MIYKEPRRRRAAAAVLLVLAVALASLTALVPARPALADPPQVGEVTLARWHQLAGELERLRTGPLGLVPLLDLEQHTRWVPFSALLDVLPPVVEAADTDPLVRAAAAHRIARAHLAAGDVEASAAVIASEGFVTAWSIVGPFPNDAMAGFETAYGPELARASEATFPGRHGDVGWREVSEFVRAGYVDLGRLAAPGDSSVDYAVSWLEAPSARQAWLWMSVDGAYKVWLNGELVGRIDGDLGGGAVREWWPVRLRRGANELVVKVAGDEASPGFYLRLTDRRGRPLADLGASAEVRPSETPLPATADPLPTPAGSVADAFAELLGAAAEAAPLPASEARSGAALVLRRHYPRDPSEPWRRFLQAGDTCVDGTPGALRRCAQVSDHYWEQHAALTRAAAALDPDSALDAWLWTQYELAELAYGSVGEAAYEEARDICERLLARAPDFVPARLLEARVYENERQMWRAHERFDEALALAPDSPEALYQAQYTYQQMGTTPALVDLYRRSLAQRWDEPSAAATLARALAQADDLEGAMDVLGRSLAVQPLTLGIYRLQADLLLSAGHPGDAEAVLRDALAVFPGSAQAWEALGRVLLTADDHDGAAAAFAEALAIEPQNNDLAQYRQALIAGEETFYADYRLDLDTLQALAVPDELAEGRDYTVVAQQRLTRVFPNGLYSQYVQEAFRVQTRRGADQLREYSISFTPDDETIEILGARIVKPDGTVLESFDRWEESLSQPWYGLYYDLRALVLGFETLGPGDLVEVEYTLSNVSQRNMFDDYYGDFVFVQDNQPKAFMRVGVFMPEDRPLHVRPPTLPHDQSTAATPFGFLTLIELHDVPRVEVEASMPGRSSVADYIHLSTFETWSQVSGWYWNLVEDQLVAGPEIERTVNEIIEGLDTPEERVRAIHEYVVRNIRYVGLEFGIHGYRPYRTTVAFARRFGDCKDTASLIKVMLGVAGIEANLVLVRTRDLGNVDPDPPSLALFNHAIAYVPELDLFLDGTAGYNGVDELPYLDHGASILIVHDGPDHDFTTLPFLPASTNQLIHEYTVDLTAEGAPTAGTITAIGQFAPPMRVRYESEENRLEEFQRDFTEEFPGSVVTDLELAGLTEINQPVVAQFAFQGATWLQGADDARTLRPLGMTTDIAQRLAGTATRRQPLQLDFPFETTYRVDYTLPAGMRLAEGPVEQNVETDFGTFHLVMEPGEGTLHVEAELHLVVHEVSVDDYPAFRDFLLTVERAINRNVALERSTDG